VEFLSKSNLNKKKIFVVIENSFAYFLLSLLAVLPFLDIIARKLFHTSIYSVSLYIQHIVLWLTFIAGVITTREERHLSFVFGLNLLKEPLKSFAKSFTLFLSIFISFLLFLSSFSFSLISVDPEAKIGFLSVQVILFMLPFALFINTLHFISLFPKHKFKIIWISLAILLALFIGVNPILNIFRYFFNVVFSVSGSFLNKFEAIAFSLERMVQSFVNIFGIPIIVIIIISTLVGTPIYILLSGIALFLFLKSNGSIEVIPNESYTMLTGSYIPAIPLFAFAGFILSESRASDRLINLFHSLLGWIPGGLAIISVIVCAFFTTFTGASGVTILALGGLLLYMFEKNGYKKNFSTGLLTASGSIGLLFPPSLPIIMYGVTAMIDIRNMFVGGIIPGIVMLVVLMIMGIRHSLKNKVERTPFDFEEFFQNIIYAVRFPLLFILLHLFHVINFVSLLLIFISYFIIQHKIFKQNLITKELILPLMILYSYGYPVKIFFLTVGVIILYILYEILINKNKDTALGEVSLPMIILVSYFKGVTTLVETSAVAVIYLFILEVLIHRDIKFFMLHLIFKKSIPVIGGILMILAFA